MPIYLPTKNLYRVWFSRNENSWLPLVNQLRLIRFLEKNKSAKITVIIRAACLSELALEAMQNFKRNYSNLEIVDVDFLFGTLTHPMDRALAQLVLEEVGAGQMASARDILTTIPFFAYKFGQYSDFDATVSVDQLPEYVELDWPTPILVVPIPESKRIYEYKRIYNDLILVTSSNKEPISEADVRLCLEPFGAKIIENYTNPLDVFERLKNEVDSILIELIREKEIWKYSIPDIHAKMVDLLSFEHWKQVFINRYNISNPLPPETSAGEIRSLIARYIEKNPLVKFKLEESDDFNTSLRKLYQGALDQFTLKFVVYSSGPGVYKKVKEYPCDVFYRAIRRSFLSTGCRTPSDMSWLPEGQRKIEETDHQMLKATRLIQKNFRLASQRGLWKKPIHALPHLDAVIDDIDCMDSMVAFEF